jgi:choline dehydrogenase-like flavoprotein
VENNRERRPYARGKVLGGCSSINAMVYMRGQSGDYDRWAKAGNAGWSWSEVLPFFMKHEDFVHGADDVHGAGGEWRIEEQRLHWPILDVFRDSCVEAEFPRSRTLIAEITSVSAIFRSTKDVASASMQAKPFCGRPSIDKI